MPTKVFTVSPSQVEVFDRECERKWAFDKIAGLPRKPNPHAQFGTRMHSVGENWLDNAVTPNLKTKEGRAFAPGIKHWPMPGTPTLQTERGWYFTWDGVTYHGYADVVSDFAANGKRYKGKYRLVGDHKSTGDFKWAKSAEDLQNDPQFLMYGAMFCVAEEASGILGRWVYYNRNKPKTKKVELRMSREEVWARFVNRIHPVGLAIIQAKKEPLEKRPRNESMCHKYGECPYIKVCRPKGGAGFFSVFSQYFRSSDRRTTNEDDENVNEVEVPMSSALMSKLNNKNGVKKTPKKKSVRKAKAKAPEPEPEEDEEDDDLEDDEDDEIEGEDDDEVDEPEPEPTPKTRGRPKGSKNKPKDRAQAMQVAAKAGFDLNALARDELFHVVNMSHQLGEFSSDEQQAILEGVAAVLDR